MEIIGRKWDSFTMDFVVSLPTKVKGFHAIWVIVHRLTKCAHFFLINIKYFLEKFIQLYIKEIVHLHGVPSSIISNRNPWFTSRFWQSLHQDLWTKLRLNDKSKRRIQSLENLLRACMLDHLGSWDDVLSLVEFT
ncbi:hypothetical protein CR513_19916, partial [Mucuna pruriens]